MGKKTIAALALLTILAISLVIILQPFSRDSAEGAINAHMEPLARNCILTDLAVNAIEEDLDDYDKLASEVDINVYTNYEELTIIDIPHGYIGYSHVIFMSRYLPNRIPFSYSELDAALWIMDELLDMGYAYEDIKMQVFAYDCVSQWSRNQLNFVYTYLDWFYGQTKRNYSQNVILTVPAQSNQKIIVGAHYDSLPFSGASDNASGVALLLESAQRMLSHDNYYTIVYIFFGAEEIGLLGAHYYLASLSEEENNNILLMVNADVLLDGPYLLYSVGYGYNFRQVGINDTTQAVIDIAYDLKYSYGLELIAWPEGIFLSSDHLVFTFAGHTVLNFAGLNLLYDGRFTLDVFHTYRDTYDFISETWPDRILRAMNVFSILLERVLLQPGV